MLTVMFDFSIVDECKIFTINWMGIHSTAKCRKKMINVFTCNLKKKNTSFEIGTLSLTLSFSLNLRLSNVGSPVIGPRKTYFRNLPPSTHSNLNNLDDIYLFLNNKIDKWANN